MSEFKSKSKSKPKRKGNGRNPYVFLFAGIVIGGILVAGLVTAFLLFAGNANQLRLYARIYVSRHGEPFVIKSRDESEDIRNYVSLDYTIVD